MPTPIHLDVSLQLLPVPPYTVLSVAGDVESMLGYSASSILQGTVSIPALFHPDDQDVLAAMLGIQPRSASQPQHHHACNLRMRLANGRIRCLVAHYDQELTAAGVVLNLRLRDAKSLFDPVNALTADTGFRSMMENTNDFIFFKDRNHVFTSASQTLVSVTQPSRHWTDLIGQTDYDVFPEAYADIYYRLEKQVFAGMTAAHEIQEYETNDGLKGWVDNRKYPVRNAQGEIIGLFGIARVITDQVTAEQALRLERDSTRNILATVEAMIVALDTEGRIMLVNRKGCQILGYHEDELIGLDWFATCLPRSIDVGQVRAVFKMALAGDLSGSEYFENPVRTRSGEERLIAWHNSTIRDKDGNIIGGLAAGEDITKRKQSEFELQQREQYQRALLDNFPFAVWLKDTESRFLTVNQGFVQLFGQRNADELVGKNDFDIAPAELAEGYRVDDRAVLASGKKKNVEEEIADVDGARKWFETYKAPIFDAAGSVVGTVGFARDITERRETALALAEMSAALAQSRDLLQQIIDTAPIRVFWKDRNCRYLGCNPALARDAGKSAPSELIGLDDYAMGWAEQADLYRVDDLHVMASGQPRLNYEELQTTPQGKQLWLRTSKVPLRDASGTVIGVLGLYDDITARKQIELTLAEERLFSTETINALPGVFYMFDGNGCFLRWNQHFKEITGYSDNELATKRWPDFFSGLDRERIVAAMEQVFRDGMTSVEAVFRDRHGMGRPYLFSGTRMVMNGEAYLLGVGIDITDRKHTEQSLLLERDSTRNILATVEAMIVALDTEGRITLISRKGCEILGYREDELIGQDWFATCLPRGIDVVQVRAVFKMALAGDLAGSEYFENTVRTRSGEERLIAWHNSAIRDKDGNIIGGLSAGEDITERKKAEVALRENQQLLNAVIDEIPDPVILKDRNGNFLLCNQAVARLYNTTPEAMTGKHDGDFGVPKEMADAFRNNVLAIMAKGKTEIVFEDSQDSESGEIRHFRSIKKPFKDALGQDQILVVAQDITDIINAQAKIAVSERRLQEVLAITNEGVWDWHIPSGKVLHNRQWFTLFGAKPGEIDETLEGFVKLIHPDDRKTVLQLISAMLEGSNADYHSKHRLITVTGRPIWVQDRGRVVERDKNGQAVRVIGSVTDITYQIEYQHHLEHIAHYDTLTGLPNRVLLADRLHQAMSQALRRGDKLAVAYLDLDGFKTVNDQHGHDAGDHLLTTLAGYMKRALREGDTLARLGGDEFVAVMLDLPDVESCVLLLSRLLSAAAEVVYENGDALRVSASLGVTFYPQAETIDADQLLRQADQAMYQAKLAGKNRYHIFDTEQDRSARGQHESLVRIKQALNDREFVLYYQPKVNMRTGVVIGAEALIRWQHPEQGLLPPASFLPLIADHPLAIEIGEWVLDTAMTQMEAWKAAGLALPVSVNIDAIQLEQADFVDHLRRQLAAHPLVVAGDLELEVLETSALQDIAHVSGVILACREIGVGFALDDFGTGYSSLTYLKRLPAGMLKIDQSFVRDMLDDPDDLAILDGVLGLAIAFRREAIAEGVETLAHGEILLRLGCPLAQGYVIARPMPAAAMPDWLAAWHPDAAWLGRTPIRREDLPILYAWVEHRAWIAQVVGFLQDERSDVPPLDYQACRFGQWLSHAGEQHADQQACVAAIEPLHIEIHALATAMISFKQLGQTDALLARIEELDEAATRSRAPRHCAG